MENFSQDTFVNTYCTPSPNQKWNNENQSRPSIPSLKSIKNSKDPTSKSDSSSANKNFFTKSNLITGDSDIDTIDLKFDYSPIEKTHKFNESISNSKQESAKSLLAHLKFKKERYETVKQYFESLKAQLKDSAKVLLSELETKRNALISEIGYKFNQAANELKNEERKKAEFIKEKETDVKEKINEIDNVIDRIQSRLNSDKKIWNENIALEAKEVLKKPIKEYNVTNDITKINFPDFNWKITNDDKFSETFNYAKNICNGESIVPFSEVVYNSLVNSPIKHQRYSNLSTQDKSFAEISDIKTTEKKKPKHHRRMLSIQPEESHKKTTRIKISSLISEDKTPSLKHNQIAVYIPHGYPEYSCYFILTCEPNIDSREIISSLSSHIGSVEPYTLHIKISPNQNSISLKPYECPLLMFSHKSELSDYPRLYLKRQ